MESENRANPVEDLFFGDRESDTTVLRTEHAKGSGAAGSIANMDRIDFLTLLAESRILDVRTGEKVFSI